MNSAFGQSEPRVDSEHSSKGEATGENPTEVRSLHFLCALPVPLLTINARDGMHWSVRAGHVKAQREAFGWHAITTLPLDVAPLRGKVRLDVTIYPRKGQKEPDEGGKWEAVKPWVDGLQDAGVFAEGDDKVVVYGTFQWVKERRTGEVRLTLTAAG